MMVIVTEHARNWLLSLERFGCKPQKVQKTAEKAWASREPLPPIGRWQNKLEKNHLQGKTFRFYMGRVFVFAPYIDKSVLITVIPLNKKKTVLT